MSARGDISTASTNPQAPALETRLANDLGAALSEASRFFAGKGEVQEALREICARLDQMGIPYAVAGGMAVFAHGLRRVTEDVGLLIRPESLVKIHQTLEGLGYVRLFQGSKNLRDVRHGVRIEFLLTGQYPGDGRPKPVCFPAPEDVAEMRDGIRFLNLPTLIELKLASGISNANRLKDLGDVQEMIHLLAIPRDFSQQLNPYVRPKFEEMWDALHEPRWFVRPWRRSPENAAQLAAMLAVGVMVESSPTQGDESVRLVTNDSQLARKYDMHEESEFGSPNT